MIVENLVSGDRLALVISAAYFFIKCIKVTFSYSISRSILHHQTHIQRWKFCLPYEEDYWGKCLLGFEVSLWWPIWKGYMFLCDERIGFIFTWRCIWFHAIWRCLFLELNCKHSQPTSYLASNEDIKTISEICLTLIVQKLGGSRAKMSVIYQLSQSDIILFCSLCCKLLINVTLCSVVFIVDYERGSSY